MGNKPFLLAIIHMQDPNDSEVNWDCVAYSTVYMDELQRIVDEIKKEFEEQRDNDWTFEDICNELFEREILFPVKEEVDYMDIFV